MFSKRKISMSRSHLLLSLGSVFVLAIISASTFLALAQRSRENRVQAATSFTFTATGDYGQTSNTTAVLQKIKGIAPSFNLGLGDLNYDYPSISAQQWASNALSELGSTTFPFEFVAGDHDYSNGNGDLSVLETSLPDRLGNISGRAYGEQYSFDYPASNPLARFIMVSPSIFPGGIYDYTQGGTDYNWVSQQIDDARASNIPWIIVAMAIGCLYINSPSGSQACLTPDLMNLLLSKKVDLILQAHLHYYAMSKQLALNSTTCTSLSTTSYNASCVVDSSKNLTKYAGTTIVSTGTGGKSLVQVDTSDPKIGYFKTWMGSNANPTYGVSQFTIAPTKLTAQFVAVSGGSYTNSFTITGSNPTPTPTPTPSPSPTPTMTPSPTATPSPTPSPTPSITPSPTLSPTPTPPP